MYILPIDKILPQVYYICITTKNKGDKKMIILGRMITNKAQAGNLIADLSSRFDGTLESSVAILDVEDKLVKAGFLDWNEVEAFEFN